MKRYLSLALLFIFAQQIYPIGPEQQESQTNLTNTKNISYQSDSMKTICGLAGTLAIGGIVIAGDLAGHERENGPTPTTTPELVFYAGWITSGLITGYCIHNGYVHSLEKQEKSEGTKISLRKRNTSKGGKLDG